MRPVAVDYGYTIERLEDRYLISVPKKKLGFALHVLLFFPAFIFWAMVMYRLPFLGSVMTGLVMLMAAIASAATSFFIVRHLEGRRKPDEIVVFRDFVDANGLRYEQQHITGLRLEAPKEQMKVNMPDQSPPSTLSNMGAMGLFGIGGVIAAGMNVIVQLAQLFGAAIGFLIAGGVNSSRRSRGWAIWFNYGRQPTKLIQGLDQNRAELLHRDLHRLIFVEF